MRDELSNAIGGLRLPAADVPTFASYGEQANECAFTLGKTVPFDAATLKRLYPTHADYVAKVQDAAARSVEAGWLLPVDARAVVAAATAAPIPN